VALGLLPGSSVQIYSGNGADNAYTNEAMEAVVLAGHATRTVYRITAAAKRIMNDSVVPAFQKQTGGAGDWNTITPSEIWYGAGYVVLSTAQAANDLIRCATGNYLTPAQIFGCVARSFNDKTLMADVTCYGDTTVKRQPMLDDWDGKLDVFAAKMCAELTTDTGAANGHIRLWHTVGGLAGHAASLEISAPSGSAPVAVTVSTAAITVAPPTGGTANACIAAINASADVIALNIRAERPAGETGAGAVAAFTHAHLAGGLDPIAFKDWVGTRVAFRIYTKYSTLEAFAGFGYIESVDWTGKPSDPIKCGITVTGDKYQLRNVIA
jgi:hypothetical protein